ncbi:MOSC domain-containing protein [Yoonia sediminilitoris]|uniref:MOSC domain-containing protein n=1 Tax=Yoonia sediminilitoris TaxID=1286148 RepID=A0A2T6KPT9_9RHOB|nr:MOSC domain-containing protein [Yoonia sediminilitoris]PUB18548.1 MOSC domain-containing protein [Yoonia sediminilitoris]RCW98716.1 MOSC domain-containing protein [Yoonia sediminilitoris]
MPALKPTDIYGEVVWIGHVPDRTANLRSSPQTQAQLTFAGIPGESHGGLTRPACVRVRSQYPKGTEIRNVRQLSVMSAEELAEIAADCGLDAFDPAHIGASLVISGIPDFTHLPPSSRLQFADGSAIVVDMENRPCHLPAKVINQDVPGAGDHFKAAAQGKRGVTAWIEREGRITVGDGVRLHVPDQRAWRP